MFLNFSRRRGSRKQPSRKKDFFGLLQNFTSHVACDGWKTFEKFFQCIVVFQIFEKRLHRNARAFEDRRAAQNFRVNGDQIIWNHGENISFVRRSCKSQGLIPLRQSHGHFFKRIADVRNVERNHNPIKGSSIKLRLLFFFRSNQ
jgi:hypothetical protein